AQDTPAALSDKLERLQEQVEVHTAQIAEHAQTKVESDARFRVKLSGILLANTFFNSHDTSLNDVPLIAPAPGAITRKNNFGASLRQSRIGLTMEGPRLGNALGNARLGAEAEFDFWAGDFPDVNGLFRILTASTRLDWERTSLIVGQRQPMISPLNPTSLAAYWFPALTAAGNLGQWRPQIMLEHRAPLNESSQFIAQAGLLMPFGETLQETTIEGGLGYQSRLAYRHEATQDRPLEIGLGGYLHRRALPLARNINSWALTGDWQAPLGSRVRLTGEAYYGQAISLGEPTVRADRVYAANGLITRQAVTVRGVRSAGGWAQLALRAHARLEFNLAYGQNDPRNADINAGARNTGTRYKNQAASANFIWQAQQNFLISLEFRRLLTHYPTARQTGNHLNLAFGYVF
ncbi:MAG: hypothetical protein ACKV2V_08295, partial [Blastocatellia bacterium]